MFNILNLFRRQEEDEPITAAVSAEGSTTYAVPRHGNILIGNEQDHGSRPEQQDSFGISSIEASEIKKRGLLAVVADGMGGLNNGAVYSKAAVNGALCSFREEEPEQSDEATLLRVLKRAKEEVAETGLYDGGTTFVATLIHQQQLHFISVGDSRICLMRNGGLIQLNREHVYGRELDDQALNGKLTELEAHEDRQRKALTSYLGKQDDVAIDRNINPIPLYSGDKVILMSDGVYGFLPEQELTECLNRKPMDAAVAVKQAVLAKKHPKQDNLTIIVMEIE